MDYNYQSNNLISYIILLLRRSLQLAKIRACEDCNDTFFESTYKGLLDEDNTTVTQKCKMYAHPYAMKLQVFMNHKPPLQVQSLMNTRDITTIYFIDCGYYRRTTNFL